MVDALAGIVAYLLAEEDLSELVEQRIFGGELPEDEHDAMPRKALVLTFAGTGAGVGEQGDAPLQSVRVDAWAYGEDYYEAGQVYAAARKALKGLRRVVAADCLLHSAQVSGGPIQRRDPETGWRLVWSSYLVLASESPASTHEFLSPLQVAPI